MHPASCAEGLTESVPRTLSVPEREKKRLLDIMSARKGKVRRLQMADFHVLVTVEFGGLQNTCLLSNQTHAVTKSQTAAPVYNN